MVNTSTVPSPRDDHEVGLVEPLDVLGSHVEFDFQCQFVCVECLDSHEIVEGRCRKEVSIWCNVKHSAALGSCQCVDELERLAVVDVGDSRPVPREDLAAVFREDNLVDSG